MSNQLKVLVVDDMPVNLRVVQALIRQMGHQALVASNGIESIAMFEQEHPDIVLMDVMMPGMNGFEAAHQIKSKVPESEWVPIIFLTSLTDEQSLLRGVLEEGGDDYLYKPVTMATLKAKLNSFGRILRLQQQINQQNKELWRLTQLSEQENEIAAGLMDKIIKSELIEKSNIIKKWNIPTSNFSGDLIVAEKTPSGVWHILLADGTGHGLSAALSVLPMAQPFYSMTRKGFRIGQIALQINRTMHELLPGDRFAGAILLALDHVQNTIEIWNGGMPDVYLVSPEGGDILYTWKSKHLPLGILEDEFFSTDTEYFVYQRHSQIILCSDGLLEAENKEQIQFGQDKLMQVIQDEDPFEQRLEMISDALTTHLNGVSPADDVSLLVIYAHHRSEYDSELKNSILIENKEEILIEKDTPWEMYLHLGAEQLRRLEVVPLIHQILRDLESSTKRSSELFVVLSELLCNAIDHGILGLDSKMKECEDGMDIFYEARLERLRFLSNGYLGVKIEKIFTEQGAQLMICISCTGNGFDYRSVMARAKEMQDNFYRPYGRGVPLLMKLCETLEYSDQGREALVVFQL
jgi:two-component system, HptB-dependent secretion and biofilm response regulator